MKKLALSPIGSFGAPDAEITRGCYVDMRGVLQPGETLSGTPTVSMLQGGDLLEVVELATNIEVVDVGGVSIGVGYAISFRINVLKQSLNDKTVSWVMYWQTTAGDKEPVQLNIVVRKATL